VTRVISALCCNLTQSTFELFLTYATQPHRYVIINTAISSTWGFPTPCPYGCACDCFDCRNPDCACAVPHDMCQNLPAHFLIDYVRVYQVET
jgi:hypothetical protein